MGLVLPLDELLVLRARLREERCAVVFTNGVFDILHRGHCEYLAAARALGGALFVGVNTDASVRRIKGGKRPIVPEADRAYLLAQLSCVDAVTLFDEDTPARLIELLVPDILVKGGDYEAAEIVGRETVERAGGRVVTVPLIEGRSTTNIIRTIVERFCP
ncbi:MAG: D-glycero-beta-D-manno-heptose 1-phosphate adenylyltransferase [Bacteroidota bacterium]|nr:D-glycero-beta-D-manno-heptose 1-phosphate adenylyltransferase [Bacteroidota bacterium]